MAYDANAVRRLISEAMEKKSLSAHDVEQMAGLPRSSIYNFLSGRVKEPRMDVVVGASKILNISPEQIFNLVLPEKPITQDPKEYNKELFLECCQNIVEALEQRHLNPSLEQTIDAIKSAYVYYQQYCASKFSPAFVNWIIDNKWRMDKKKNS